MLEKVKIRGDILLGKVYGYTDQYSDLKEVLLSNTFTVVPSLRYGISQKNNADILLVIDALEVAFTNPLIDSFCIVSGDSDYTPLVGRLKSMGKFVLGISRSAAASNIFINACNEFQFLENVGGRTRKPTGRKRPPPTRNPWTSRSSTRPFAAFWRSRPTRTSSMPASLKGILLRLRPDFNEKSYGCTTFLKLLDKLSKQFGALHIRSDNFNVMVSLAQSSKESAPEMNKENWRALIREQLARYKEDGFERINPSILKADIQASFPGFSEKALGFKRFSDMLKAMEKEGLITVELDDQKNMLIKVS